MAQRNLCGDGGAPHAVVGVRAVEGGSAAALQGGGRMARPRWYRRAVWNSPHLSSRALESGRVSSQAGAAEESGASSLTALSAVVQGGQQGDSASLRGMPAEGGLCLHDGAHAVLADHMGLRPPQGVRLVMQGFLPLRAKVCLLGPSNGQTSVGPWRIASWVVATAERYAALPSSGPVCARPKPPWRSGRVSWSVGGLPGGPAPYWQRCSLPLCSRHAPPQRHSAPACSLGAGAQRVSGGCSEGRASSPGPPRAVPGGRPSGGRLAWHGFQRLLSGRRGCILHYTPARLTTARPPARVSRRHLPEHALRHRQRQCIRHPSPLH
jgi:hypothetical protein